MTQFEPTPVQLKSLFETVESLARQVEILRHEAEESEADFRDAIDAVSTQVAALRTLIYGNSEFRLVGLADRMEKIENLVEQILDERKSEKDRLKGIQIGLGLTGVGTAGTLFAVLSQLMHGG